MGDSEDQRHVNEFGEIEVLKDTKYWFKRDFQTIKRSFFSTIRNSPFVFIVAMFFSFLMSGLGNTKVGLDNILAYTLIFFPISLLGYFMFYVMIKKGYDIEPYVGTHINSAEHTNRFSVSYVVNSNMSTGRKTMFLVRLALYFLMVIGLLLSVFQKYK